MLVCILASSVPLAKLKPHGAVRVAFPAATSTVGESFMMANGSRFVCNV
jgi:hypothetical protein